MSHPSLDSFRSLPLTGGARLSANHTRPCFFCTFSFLSIPSLQLQISVPLNYGWHHRNSCPLPPALCALLCLSGSSTGHLPPTPSCLPQLTPAHYFAVSPSGSFLEAPPPKSITVPIHSVTMGCGGIQQAPPAEL